MQVMVRQNFENTLAAIELNAARKLNWNYQQFKDCFSFKVNNEAIEIEHDQTAIKEPELEILKQALLDYGFQYKKTINDFILVFEQDVELR
ncbi:asr2369 [Nostoc sp. PCC 7120 = FACHB-418]|nr:asr2369 [Nostoc sp. PCC 7120 = FACHB-418]